ncbi:helicase-exonuclease AddAB subunit AddA [Bacillaceae bacterium S4-13-56]
MMKWTPEQEQAIYSGQQDILVAAAAGSGKTAVLVERIIQKLMNKESPMDIDSLLVVTFTNAAAQEMRNRVGAALEKALEQEPSSIHLKKQLSLLQRASISTLHSFCMDVVRKYAFRLDLDPHFRMLDEIEGDLLKEEILQELFEKWYGEEGEDRDLFFEVVERFSSDRSDAEVEDLILQLYEFSRQHPWPHYWLDGIVNAYDVKESVSEEELDWLDLLKKDVQFQLEYMISECQKALQITREKDGPYHYAEAVEQDLLIFEDARKILNYSWQELQEWATSIKGFAKLSAKRVDVNDDKKEKVKDIRNRYKKLWQSMLEQWFLRSLPAHLQDLEKLKPVIGHLMKLVKEFGDRFQQTKKENALVDFSDLEHYCLQLLMEEGSTPNDVIPSVVAKEFHKQFHEILVDEYQDTNLVQETILQLLVQGEESGYLFMVGDVKQSIYRFRHAEPSLFVNKYKAFAHDPSQGLRIDLARNFRSRKEVLAGANYIFRQLFDETVGELVYDEAAELIYSNQDYDQFPNPEVDAELMIIDRQEHEETDEEGTENYRDLEKAQLEARAYAMQIRKWIGKESGHSMQVVDKKTSTLRNIQYRDIVILLRSMTWAPSIVEELKKQGIPVYAELSSGYFEAIEIQVMLSLLKTVDNPLQDIPLASVLKSPMVGLNEQQLSEIRLTKKRSPFFEALKEYHKQQSSETMIWKKVDRFLQQFAEWRRLAKHGALSELIWGIFRDTGYYDFVGGMSGGKQRQANLRALYDRARQYESTSFRGLFRFLRFIERMEKKGEDLGAARALGEQEDVVRIMTIHKSKGLEFPVVIVGAMDKMFNEQDLKRKFLLHKDWGFASKFIDPEKRIMYPTLLYHGIKSKMQKEMLAEEMRVLYVALTRAKEKLVMIGSVNSLEKKKERWKEMLDHQDLVLPPYERLRAKTYLDWVGATLIRHQQAVPLRDEHEVNHIDPTISKDSSTWQITLLHGSQLGGSSILDEDKHEDLWRAIQKWEPLNQDAVDPFINQQLTYEYPFKKASDYRAKQTVTEIKRQRELKDEYSDEQYIRSIQKPILARPRFMQKNKELTPTERGSAMHTVMQHFPFDRVYSEEELKEFIQGLVTKEVMSQEEGDSVDITAILQFFETPIGIMMLESPSLFREVPFSLTLPASEVYAQWEGEEERVLIQGVVDCLVPYQDGWILLDYKTDQIPTSQKATELQQRYAVQLEMYARAIERIWKKPIKKKYLYFFSASVLVEA